MGTPQKRTRVEVQDKLLLNFYEAAEYSGIGINRLRKMASDNTCEWSIRVGNKKHMIVRDKFERFIKDTKSI